MRKFALILFVGLAGVGPSLAQQQTPVAPSPAPHLPGSNQQTPPTKKVNGFCVPPDSPNYARIKDFIPFVSLQDCLKSGGHLAK